MYLLRGYHDVRHLCRPRCMEHPEEVFKLWRTARRRGTRPGLKRSLCTTLVALAILLHSGFHPHPFGSLLPLAGWGWSLALCTSTQGYMVQALMALSLAAE